jgi:hypothetical protein
MTTVTPTIEAAATQQTPTGLAVGGTAKINAAGGLNVREQASRSAKLVGKLNSGVVVALIGGPATADGYTWWQVDNGSGLTGWLRRVRHPTLVITARGAWPRTPAEGAGFNRPIELRPGAGYHAGNQVRLCEGAGWRHRRREWSRTEFIVRGLSAQNEMLAAARGRKVNGWLAEGQGEDRWLTPVEP